MGNVHEQLIHSFINAEPTEVNNFEISFRARGKCHGKMSPRLSVRNFRICEDRVLARHAYDVAVPRLVFEPVLGQKFVKDPKISPVRRAYGQVGRTAQFA